MRCYYHGTLEAFAVVSSISLITFHACTAYVICVIRNSLFVSALEAVRPPMEMHAIAGWLEAGNRAGRSVSELNLQLVLANGDDA